MIITQVSIKLKNSPGELHHIGEALGDSGVNIRTLTASVHETNAQVHLILDNPEKGLEVLKNLKYDAFTREVIAVKAPDHPGGLDAVMKPLHEAGVNLEFLYPMIGRTGPHAVIIVGADDNDKAIRALQNHYISILNAEMEGI